MSTEKTPIAELELVVINTNALTINDATLAEAVAILKPIADGIPDAIERSKSLTVASANDADEAAKLRDAIIEAHDKAIKTINEFDNGIIGRLYNLHRRWTAFRNMFSPLEDAAKVIKGHIIAWQEDERKKAAAEQARLQAEADERARKEKERLEKEAAKLKTPEKIQERLEAAAAVVAPVIRVSSPVAAVRTQKRWTVASVDKSAFLAAAAETPMLQGYIEIIESALVRSKAANELLEVPGVKFEKRVV